MRLRVVASVPHRGLRFRAHGNSAQPNARLNIRPVYMAKVNSPVIAPDSVGVVMETGADQLCR